MRAALIGRPTAVVRGYVRRHPCVVERLVADVGDLDLLPAELPAAVLTATAGDITQKSVQIVARQEAFAAAPDAAVRAALLWPGLIGALDGASVPARVEANRLLLRAELGRARRADVDLELRAIARRVADASSLLNRLRGRLLTAWLTRDVITSYITTSTDLPLLARADLRVRILLYQGLLYDRVRDPLGGHAPDLRRRLLLFDPAGRGRLAELWGHLDADTEAVAVLVPGTGTAVRGFHLPTQVARDLAAAAADAAAAAEVAAEVKAAAGVSDAVRPAAGAGVGVAPSGGTAARVAAIAWMGADFPLAIGSNAPFARYALAAAAPLRDFVLGLAVPAKASLTVLGHSYGGTMVGAAERLGLPADRIVHVASPGAGPGVRGVADYATLDPLGRPRDPQRYTLTAPGDPIRFVQRFEAPWGLLPVALAGPLRARLAGLSLGVDPERLAGIRVLSAGTWLLPRDGRPAGTPVAGPAAHAAVMEPGTQAFARLAEVVARPP